MNEEIILNDWNPTDETLRKWAFDENMLLSDQDEDLVLHQEDYLPVLLELASDSTCPKSDYILSCLDFYLKFLVLRGSELNLILVRNGAQIAAISNCEKVREWGKLQERRLQYRSGIGAVSRELALQMGSELLNGVCREAEISIVGETSDTWQVELSVQPFHRHKERLVINKFSGTFTFSR